MTGSMCDFSIQHYACLPQVALSQFCTLCTDTVHVKLFDFIILSVISGIQTQSRAAVTAHRVQAFWQRELPQRNVEAVLHQILCKSWRCSSNPFQHGKDMCSYPKRCLIAIHTCKWIDKMWECLSLYNLMKRLSFCQQTFLPQGPSVALVLDVLTEVTVDQFTPQELKDLHFIQKWFQHNLRPFLPHASGELLSCLSSKDFSCETYQTM